MADVAIAAIVGREALDPAVLVLQLGDQGVDVGLFRLSGCQQGEREQKRSQDGQVPAG